MKFTFLFHDGSEIVFKANDCKHYTGHAALTDATILKNTKNGVPIGKHFDRFNVALNADLFGMFPEEDEKKDFIADCTGFCNIHTDTLTKAGRCQKCTWEDIPF